MTNANNIDWDNFYDEEDKEDIGSVESHGSIIKHLLSQVRIGMDLTKVVLPTFILERRSLLEMYADFFAHPDLFSNIGDHSSAQDRMINLLRWYLSAFHAGRKSSLAKKPYNPIIGEVFHCHWNLSETQKLTFVAEQVSHHPPVSAFYAENKDKNISCQAHIYTKSKYLGLSIGVQNIGQAVITLHKHNETYVCTFPSAYGRSILTTPWVELGGSVDITCKETGFTAKVEFLTKPFYGGKKHRIVGELFQPNGQKLLEIEGEWNGCMVATKSKDIFVDTQNLPIYKKCVKPIAQQQPYESRNVWKEVTRALKMRDVERATAEKSRIEQRQRDLLQTGVDHQTRYFEAAKDGTWTLRPNSL